MTNEGYKTSLLKEAHYVVSSLRKIHCFNRNSIGRVQYIAVEKEQA